MNVFGQRERSWRKARQRAVSPIIATILLVAITVVLAAVLYVLISGLTHGPSSAPLGTNFSWGSPVNTTGVASTGCGSTSATHSFCYSIEIAGSSVTTSNFILALRNSAGATIAWPATTNPTTCRGASAASAANGCGSTAATGTAQIALISPTNSTPIATFSTTSSGWILAPGFTGSVSGGYTIVLWMSAAAGSPGLFGYELVAIGSSGYSGSVPSNAFS